MAEIVYASMTNKGYITDGKTILDELFSLSLLSRYSQTDIYYESIVSFDKMMQQYSSDPGNLANILEKNYGEMYSRHFDKAQVNVKAVPPSDTNTAWSVTIQIRCEKNGISFDLSEVLEYKDGATKRTIGAIDGNG